MSPPDSVSRNVASQLRAGRTVGMDRARGEQSPGAAATPDAGGLAAEGAVVEHAYSNSGWTAVSTPSFMT